MDAFVGLITIGYIKCGVSWSGRDIAPQVTAEKVRQIDLGLDEKGVGALLGPPLEKETPHDGRVEWRYARPVVRVERYPMLAITLQDGCVQRVFSEMSALWGLDEDFLYLRSDAGNGEAVELAQMFNQRRRVPRGSS